MKDISLECIYPNIIKILDEINLFRVVDNKSKESIVVYASVSDDKYHINMTNTNFGNIVNICKVEKLLDIDKIMNEIIKNKQKIIQMDNFSEVEKYLLNIGE